MNTTVAATPVLPAPFTGMMTPAEVAKLLNVSEKTLERWRMTGEGPRFCRVSKKVIRYPGDLLVAFLSANIVSSTAA